VLAFSLTVSPLGKSTGYPDVGVEGTSFRSNRLLLLRVRHSCATAKKCSQAARGGNETLFHAMGGEAQILLSLTSMKFWWQKKGDLVIGYSKDRCFFNNSSTIGLQQCHTYINPPPRMCGVEKHMLFLHRQARLNQHSLSRLSNCSEAPEFTRIINIAQGQCTYLIALLH